MVKHRAAREFIGKKVDERANLDRMLPIRQKHGIDAMIKIIDRDLMVRQYMYKVAPFQIFSNRPIRRMPDANSG